MTGGTPQARTTSKVVILFPGQGAQTPNMFAALAEDKLLPPLISQYLREAEAILGYDVVSRWENTDSNDTVLNQTEFTQPAMYIASFINYEILRLKYSKTFQYQTQFHLAGFSLGEYTALAASGVISFQDGLRLVLARSQAMQFACEHQNQTGGGGMATIMGLTLDQVLKLCNQYKNDNVGTGSFLDVANHLFDKAIVIAGSIEGLDWFQQEVEDSVRVIRLNVGGAFHTKAMKSAQPHLQTALEAINPMPMNSNTALYSNVSGDCYPQNQDQTVSGLNSILLQQLVSPVRWLQTMQTLLEVKLGETLTVFELGPGKQLGSMLRRVDPKSYALLTSIQLENVTDLPRETDSRETAGDRIASSDTGGRVLPTNRPAIQRNSSKIIARQPFPQTLASSKDLFDSFRGSLHQFPPHKKALVRYQSSSSSLSSASWLSDS